MSGRIITLLGSVVCGGIILLAIVFGVAPLVSQSLSTASESAEVTQANALYEQQISVLRQQEEQLDEITLSIAALRQGITAAPQLDDVFELVARAAESAGVTVETIEAGQRAAFAPRTAAVRMDDAVEAAAQVEAEPEASVTPDGEAEPSEPVAEPTDPAADPTGRSQVDFTIRVDAADMGQVVAFLDALRENPRLFTTVETLVSSTGIVLDVDVNGLAYFLPED